MKRASRCMAVAVFAAACSEPTPPAPPAQVARWTCPDGWSAYPRGGCVPAALLCDADAGACPNTRAWHEPGEPGGPPAADWSPETGRGAPDESWTPEVGIAACPPGWRRAAGVCDPALRSDCPEGSAPLPGGLCVATAAVPCATDAFPEPDAPAPGARVVRVRAGADAATADGSSERPFATIAEGITGAGDNGQVLVAPGEYSEALNVTGHTQVVGRCGVVLTGAAGRATVSVRGATASLDLRRVTITGAGGPGVTAAGGARAAVRGVRIVGALGFGIDAEDAGTVVTAEGLVITGTTSRRDSLGRSADGDALVARGGARLTASHVFADANHEVGAYVATGATLTLSDSVVRGTLPRPDGEFGQGLLAEARGVLSATRTVVETSYSTGAQAAGMGATLRLEDCVVRGTRSRESGTRGWGVVAADLGVVEAARVLIADSRGAGALASGMGSSLTLTASVVRGTRTNGAPERTGYGLLAREGGALVAEGVLVEGSEGVGVYARGPGTLTLDGAVVRGTAVGTLPLLQDGTRFEAAPTAVGVVAVGAVLRATHVRVEGEVSASVMSVGTPDASRVTVSDAVLRNDRPGMVGMGLVAGPGAVLEATRVRMVNSRVAGANATGAGASIALDDCVVQGTRRGREGATTGALQALSGGALTARHVRIEDSEWCGASVGGSGSSLTIEDSVVLRSGRAVGEIVTTTPSIAGLQAYQGGAIVARRVRVEDTVGEAVDVLNPGTTIALEDAVLRAGGQGFGVLVRSGAAVEARRALVEDSTLSGFYMFGAGTSVLVQDSVVRETRAVGGGVQGYGLVAFEGAALTVDRTLVTDNRDIGLIGVDAETRVRLTDSAIRRTRPQAGGIGGAGLLIGNGATLDAARVLVAENSSFGIMTNASTMRLDDVTVASMRPVAQGYGVGVMAVGPVTLTAHRLALVDTHGVALAAVPADVLASSAAQGAPNVTVEDLFVQGVRSSDVSLARTGEQMMRRAAAYGVYSGAGSTLAVTRAVIDDGEVGFFVAQGSLALQQTLIARQSDTAGAVTVATPASALRLMNVNFANNLADAIRTDDALPVVDAIPVPTAPLPPTRP